MITQQIEFPLVVAVCAWCKPRELGARLGALSHGICPRHLRKMKLELEVERKSGERPRRSPPRRQAQGTLAAAEFLLW
jgi:hypothetical protein